MTLSRNCGFSRASGMFMPIGRRPAGDLCREHGRFTERGDPPASDDDDRPLQHALRGNARCLLREGPGLRGKEQHRARCEHEQRCRPGVHGAKGLTRDRDDVADPLRRIPPAGHRMIHQSAVSAPEQEFVRAARLVGRVPVREEQPERARQSCRGTAVGHVVRDQEQRSATLDPLMNGGDLLVGEGGGRGNERRDTGCRCVRHDQDSRMRE